MNTKEQDQDPENTILKWCAMEDSEYRVRIQSQNTEYRVQSQSQNTSQSTESEYRVTIQSQSTEYRVRVRIQSQNTEYRVQSTECRGRILVESSFFFCISSSQPVPLSSYLFQGARAMSSPMPHQSVTPAKTKPAPMKPLRP